MAKNNSELKGIQKKLVAAVAMVLVACIMVVSSSYAWFTLSTAPEVKGIQTSVGSNGNLEIALRTGALADIKTSSGGLTFPAANAYWGNLVDLSDTGYHFDQLALRPARLNATLNPQGASIQKTQDNVPVWTNDSGQTKVAASYAPDGYTAVQKTENDVPVWKLTDGTETPAPSQPTGATAVQATKNSVPVWIGTDGNEYAAETALKKTENDAMALQYRDYMFGANGYLKTPIYGADGRISQLEANTVNGVYNDDAFKVVDGVYGVRAIGVTSNISPEALALRNAKAAVNSAISSSKTSASISLRDDSVKLADIIVANILNSGATYGTTEVNNIKAAIDNLQAIKNELEAALKQAVVAVGVYEGKAFAVENVVFDTVSSTISHDKAGVDPLTWSGLDTQKADLLAAYGKLATLQTALTNATTEVNKLTATSGISFTDISKPLTYLLSTEHFDIIDSSTGTSYTVTEFKSLADTETLKAVRIILGTPTISIKGGVYYNVAEFSGNYSATTGMTVTGSYGGVSLDNESITVVMATNAVADAAHALPNGFHLTYITNWMSGLTVGGTAANLITDIYGYVVDLAFRTNAAGSSLLLQTDATNRVDESTATQGGGSYMEFTSGHADFTVDQVKNLMAAIRVVLMGEVAGEEIIYGVAILDMTRAITTGEVVKAPLVMANFSVDAAGVMTVNGAKSDSVITALPQNTAIAVSALVYLDGDQVENSDVAISGNSMTGTMNLQFASDAELDPMDYTYQQLDKPADDSIELDGSNLTITAVEKVTAYDIYDGANKIATIQVENGSATLDLSTVINPDGQDHSITVVAKGTDYADSEKSKAVTYTAPAAPTEAPTATP